MSTSTDNNASLILILVPRSTIRIGYTKMSVRVVGVTAQPRGGMANGF